MRSAEPAVPDQHPALAAIAGFGLQEDSSHFPRRSLTGDWQSFVSAVRRERLVPFLALAIDSERFPVTAEQSHEVDEALQQARGVALALEANLLMVVDHLGSSGIDYRVLKGPALARTIYPAPSLRGFGDIDILVRSEQIDEAIGVLAAAGYARRIGRLRAGFDSRFAKAVSLVGSSGYEVDLHRTLAPGPFGLRVEEQALFERRHTFQLGGRGIVTLPVEEHLINACYHAVLRRGPAPLITLRDIAEILYRRSIDFDRVLSLTAQWKSQALIARGIMLSSRAVSFPTEGPVLSWASSYGPSASELRAIRSYAQSSYAGQAIATLPAIPGLPAKIAFLAALMWPERQHLLQRNQGRMRGWQRAASRLIRRE